MTGDETNATGSGGHGGSGGTEPTGDATVAVVTRPGGDEAYAEPIERFLKVLSPATRRVHLLAGDGVGARVDGTANGWSSLGSGEYTGSGVVDYALVQLVVVWYLVKLRRETDLVYFHKGAMGFTLPVLVARALGLPTCVIKVGAFATEREGGTAGWSVQAVDTAQRLAIRFATATVVFTERERASVPSDRVYVSYSNYRDFDRWTARTPFDERAYTVGFVGRFATEKGISVAAAAIERLVDEQTDRTACLIGDGAELDAVTARFADTERVTVPGWIDHDDLHRWFDDIQVLIVPSEGEGLPTTIIEAMGSETVVVATPVGSIPDLVRDGETGFLLESTAVDDVTATTERVLSRDDLPAIGARARETVTERYTLSAARERFATITAALSRT